MGETDAEVDRRDDVIDALSNSLNQHGYVFHYSVLRHLERRFGESDRWVFEVAEFPVGKQPGTRIDFVVRPRGTRFFLACECKRANPSLSDWCFLRVPYVRRNAFGNQILAEHIRLDMDASEAGWLSYGAATHTNLPVYNIGLELKNQRKKGDNLGGRGAIEEAVTQVFRGVYGLLEYFSERELAREESEDGHRADATVLPVVFTTAHLWTSEADIGSGDVLDGTLPRESVADLKEVDWALYQYAVGVPLQHKLPRPPSPRELTDALLAGYLRTVAIVSSRGIDSFFKQCPILDGAMPPPLPWMP